jgi:hypothetical protein
MNFPRTHCRLVSSWTTRPNGGVTYSLSLEMCATKAVSVLIEVFGILVSQSPRCSLEIKTYSSSGIG